MPSFSHPLGVAGGGNLHLKLVNFVMPYSGNPNGTFGTVFSIGAIPINKCTFLPPSIENLGCNPPHLTRQQRIFEMSRVVPSALGVKPFGVVYLNKSSGISV